MSAASKKPALKLTVVGDGGVGKVYKIWFL